MKKNDGDIQKQFHLYTLKIMNLKKVGTILKEDWIQTIM